MNLLKISFPTTFIISSTNCKLCFLQHQLGVIPIPKTNTPERLQENLDIFGDWAGLDSGDMAAMDSLQTGQRSYPWSFPG